MKTLKGINSTRFYILPTIEVYKGSNYIRIGFKWLRMFLYLQWKENDYGSNNQY